jgi:hypothetical protein
MDLAEVSTSKLKEISQGYQLKIETLKREMEEYKRKNSVIEEEIEKRHKIEEYKRKVEEESKEKIQKIMKGNSSTSKDDDESSEKKTTKKKSDSETKNTNKAIKTNDDNADSKVEQEKKWTIDDMKKLLDKKDVKYTTNLKKADFVKLIRENNGVREMNALYKDK